MASKEHKEHKRGRKPATEGIEPRITQIYADGIGTELFFCSGSPSPSTGWDIRPTYKERNTKSSRNYWGRFDRMSGFTRCRMGDNR